MSATSIFVTTMFFLSFLGFISALAPIQFQVLSPFDFAFLGGSFIGVAGTCAIVTGIPCAVALVVFGAVSVLSQFITPVTWIKTLIFIPISMIMLYLAVRLARGGG
jgi:hypothetical protein